MSSVALPVRCDAEASFHGFGEQYDATDQYGHAFELLVSEQGIGRVPDTPEPSYFVNCGQEANFSPYDGLPTVVPAMLSLGLSGIPFVTHDVAGFSGGPSTKELYLRWTELGAFTPIMRTHEGATTRDVYLPSGRWFDVWTGDAYEGGGTVTVDAPIGRPPVFSRDSDRADLRAID